MKFRELLILILLIVPASLSLFKPGFFGASDDMHIAWLQQMDQAIVEGQIPPRYVSDLSFGFGYPLFNFIFPLPYYLAEIFHLMGLSFVYSIKAVFVLSLFASGITMYILAKYLSDKSLGLAAAVLYIYTPYRSTDIYVRGALGESLAFVFLPLIIYFLIRLSEKDGIKNNIKWLSLGGLSIAGLILSHNIVSYMFVPLSLIFGIVILRKKIFRLILFLGIGLLGSVYFWLPALLDSSLMKYETVFNYFDHFPTIKQLIFPYWGYGASVPGNYDMMSFFIGQANLLVMGMAMIYLIKYFFKIKPIIRSVVVWAMFVILVSLLMMNYRSTLLWESIPLIKYFQFPWRFLTIIVFGSSLLLVIFKGFKWRYVVAVLIVVTSMGFNIALFRPQDFLARDDQYYINRYIPVPTPSQEYLGLQEEYLRLPKMTKIRPISLYQRVYPYSESIKNIELLNSLDARIYTESDDNLILNYNKYNFPGWVGLIDGQKLKLESGEPFGQIQFKVPMGKHEITIEFRETYRNRILDLISLITIVGCIGMSAIKTKDKIPLG